MDDDRIISEGEACLDWMVSQIPKSCRRGKTKEKIIENAIKDQIALIAEDDKLDKAEKKKKRRKS